MLNLYYYVSKEQNKTRQDQFFQQICPIIWLWKVYDTNKHFFMQHAATRNSHNN